MDNFINLSQFVMSVIMFLDVIAWGVISLVKGTIGIYGALVVLLIAGLMWTIVRHTFQEYKQEKSK